MSFLYRAFMEEKMPIDDIALDASEPFLHLVQPVRVRLRVMHMNAPMLCHELLYLRRLVVAHVVEDDVDFAPVKLSCDDLIEEADVLLTGV